MNSIKKKWEKIKTDRKTLRDFGLILSGVLLVLGGLALWRDHHQWKFEWPLSFISLVLALTAPNLLAYIYKPWMMLAEIISWVILRVFLGILFYLVFSPIGIIMRLLNKDILDQNLDPKAETYWHKRIPTSKERYERLF